MNYQTAGTQLQELHDAVATVTTSTLTIPTLERGVHVRQRDGQRSDVRTGEHGAMQMLFVTQTRATMVFYAGETVLHIDGEGRLLVFVAGAWELDLVYLAQWIHDAGRARVNPRRCGHYAAIQRFFGMVTRAELSADDYEVREALARFLRRPLGSRSEMSGVEWWNAGTAIRNLELAW